MNNMSRKIILGLLVSFIFGQSNPIEIATSGARQLRMFGQLNVSHNPATLGYLAVATIDTLDITEEDIDSLVTELSEDFEETQNTENDLEKELVEELAKSLEE